MLSFFFSFFNIRIKGDEIFNYKIFRADVSKKKERQNCILKNTKL